MAATGKFTSRSGRLDSKNRRGSATTKEERKEFRNFEGGEVSEGVVDEVDDGFVLPKLPGDEPDFWEGPQWDALGFFVQYMWAFGIVFAVNFSLFDNWVLFPLLELGMFEFDCWGFSCSFAWLLISLMQVNPLPLLRLVLVKLVLM